MLKLKGGMRASYSPKSLGSRSDQTSQAPASNRDKREERVTKMVLIMIVAFLIVWSPYAIAVIYAVSKVRTKPSL